MKINDTRYVAVLALCLGALTFLAQICAPYTAYAGTLKGEKDKAVVVFSDSPYSADKIETKKTDTPKSLDENEADAEEDDYGIYESKVESSSSDNGVDMIEPVSIEYSVAGFAKVVAKIKNNLDYPVDGLRLDILFFHKSRRRSNQYQIPFKDGKRGTKPDMLMPGESGSFDFETGLKPSIIAGYRFRLVWNQFDRVEPKDTKKLPENVTRITIPAEDSDTPATEKTEPK